MIEGFKKMTPDLVFVQQTEARWVALLANVNDEFLKLEQRWRGRIDAHFRNFGNPDASLPPTHYASEGRHPIGGQPRQEVQLCAFKAFQVRLYGSVLSFKEGGKTRATFVGLHLITDKKKTKADQDLLKRVAKLLEKYRD
ncbi:hypothetical protein STHU_18370 [Allostella humosa]|uniref:hypothetical protein n=1 Tax=Stella humosa TaxID=94 RepID=UPI001138FE49|nr:hypothetical protein [Stella humosa]BBK31203.1 hypothetical protein STHU_18370 [Stella humosa]